MQSRENWQPQPPGGGSLTACISVPECGVAMTQPSPLLHSRRALIVDDELMVAIGLKADMQALGFDACDLATNRQEAFRLAMSNQPDVVLIDVCLAGGREGIEAARWLHEVCEVPSSSSPNTQTVTLSNASIDKSLVLQCCVSRSLANASSKPWRK